MRKSDLIFFTKASDSQVSEMLALSSDKSAFDQNQSKYRLKLDKEHNIVYKTLDAIDQPRWGVLSLV
jgi:hypothetical protein